MSRAPVELEESLRRLAPAFKDGAEPPATLHAGIMARATADHAPARHSFLRELSMAAALIAFVALLGFGFSRLHSVVTAPVKRSPTPSPVSGVIPWLPLPANSMKSQSPKIMWPDQAAQDIRSTVTDVRPVLLPTAIPDGFDAQFYDDASSFSVDYLAADGRKISFAIVVPNPAPGTANVGGGQRSFRGERAEYQIDDTTLPAGHRWLMWTEPGTSVGGQPGVPYFLATDGLTESEFWNVANSIGPIPAARAVRSCTISDLSAVSNGGNGATGHVIYSIALANHSSTPCSIGGFPTLSLVSNGGTVVPLQESNDPGGIVGNGGREIPSGVLPANQSVPVSHQAGPYAYVLFEWYYCGGTPPSVVAVDLALPGGRTSARVPLLGQDLASGPSRCDVPSQGRQLLVGPIQPPSAAQFPNQISQWQVAIQAPDQFVAGRTVAYTVTLTNVSGAPIALDTCPTYDEGFTPDRLVGYQLNCGPVGTVQAGASVTFAMRFTVPAKTPAGPEKFQWALRGTDLSASAGKLVTVTAG
jgi:Domain of unknown function (DUF4232)